MLFEIALIVSLVCLNGLLAMSELAIVSARPAQLRIQANQGNTGARAALVLSTDTGRFLSTVQIGITLVGIVAGAVSGATIGTKLAAILPTWGVPEAVAQELGVGLVVIILTYLTLIVGEIVPKQIALAAPERVAARVAPAMTVLSRLTAPLVWLLDYSSKGVLHFFDKTGRPANTLTDDDIHMMLSEAVGSGVIHNTEKEIIDGVMRFSDRRARSFMTPREELEVANVGETRAHILARFNSSAHSRLPLRRDGLDDIVGVLHSRDLLTAKDDGFDPMALARTVPIVGESLPALAVVDQLRDSPCHALLVYDRLGHFIGIVTPMDVLDAIVGGFDEHEMD